MCINEGGWVEAQLTLVSSREHEGQVGSSARRLAPCTSFIHLSTAYCFSLLSPIPSLSVSTHHALHLQTQHIFVRFSMTRVPLFVQLGILNISV